MIIMKDWILINVRRLGEYRKVLQRVGIFIGGSLLIYQLIQCFISIGSKNVQFYQPLFFFIPAMLFPLAAFQQMVAWKLIMKGLGVEIPLQSIVQSYAYSFLPRYIPGTVWGYLSRSEWLFQQHQISYEETNFGSLLEVEIGVTSCLSIVGIYYFLLRKEFAPPIVLALFIFILVPLLLIFFREKAKKRHFDMAFAWKRVAALLLSLFLYMANGFYYGVGLLAIVQGLSQSQIQFSPFTLLTFSAFYNLAWLVGFLIIFVPSGLGVREFILTSLVAAFLQAPSELANASAVIMRVSIILFAEVLWIGLGHGIKEKKASEVKNPQPTAHL